MRICDNCGASNSDFAKFCNECAAPLAAKESVGPVKEAEPSAAGEDPASLARSIASRVEALQRKRSADVLFVLDCTGSMQGEIDAIKDAITSFADTIEKDGVKKLVYQAPWYEDGEYRGLVEVTLVLPDALPHFVRDGV